MVTAWLTFAWFGCLYNVQELPNVLICFGVFHFKSEKQRMTINIIFKHRPGVIQAHSLYKYINKTTWEKTM